MSALDRRKSEMKEKRARLEELRRARQERQSRLESERGSGASTPAGSLPALRSRADVELLVADLLSPSGSVSAGPQSVAGSSGFASPGAPASVPTESRVVSGEIAKGASVGSEGSGSRSVAEDPNITISKPPPSTVVTKSPPTPVVAPPPPPPPKVVYNRAIQTTSDIAPSPPDALTSNARNDIDEAELAARIRAEIDAETARLNKAIEEEQLLLEEERLKGPDPNQLEGIFSAPEFGGWLEGASKIVQRALSDGYDYLKDYSNSGGGDGGDAEGRTVKMTCSFYDERWNGHRSITDVDWSPRFPELSVASYNKNPAGVNEPDGIVCVWNLHLLERPEFVFHSQSDVLAVSFSPFHPNYVVGGTYSGQILLWDTRSRSLPVSKTLLSASGHTHPIFSLCLTGTENAHNLVSASTDGTICAWQLDMLAQPQETLELVNPLGGKTDEVSVTCIAFPQGESSGTFWVGSEEGNVYPANRYDRAGSKAGLVNSEVYRGHSGPVMGIEFHPANGTVDFSDLFLTCGVDWTVKLWRSKGGVGQPKVATTTTTNNSDHTRPPPSSTISPTFSSTVHPVYSFEESDDYVFDVSWHPHHPALFGSVDGSGKFHLWNVNVDTEVPIVSTTVNPQAPRGLNKLVWDSKEGKKVAIGSSDGHLYIFDVGELAVPRESEWENLRRVVAGMIGGDSF